MTRLSTMLAAVTLALSVSVEAAEDAADKPKAKRYVITQDDTPLMFGNEIIGRLFEGTRVEVLKSHEIYLHVRATFDKNWVQGWIRETYAVPDTLADVDVLVGTGSLKYAYEGAPAPAGMQFLEVRLRLTGKENCPPRLYVDLSDGPTADVFVTYGREGKSPVYGFMRRRPGSRTRFFEKDLKSQIILLKAGVMLEESYVFTVPARATRFELRYKDQTHPIRLR
jgi:hypothetical protein